MVTPKKTLPAHLIGLWVLLFGTLLMRGTQAISPGLIPVPENPACPA